MIYSPNKDGAFKRFQAQLSVRSTKLKRTFAETKVHQQHTFFGIVFSTHSYSGTYKRKLNYLRMIYRFEKIILFPCLYIRQHLTCILRGAWHTMYAMLLSNYKCDDTIDLLQ